MGRSRKKNQGRRTSSQRRKLLILSDSHPAWRWAVIIATILAAIPVLVAGTKWIAARANPDPPESVRAACQQLKDELIARRGLRRVAGRGDKARETPEWRNYVEELRKLTSLASRSGDEELSIVGNEMWNLLNGLQRSTNSAYLLRMVDAYNRFEERCAQLGVPVYWSTGKVESSIDRRDFVVCRDVESIALLLKLSQTEDWRGKRQGIVELLHVGVESLSRTGPYAKSDKLAVDAAAAAAALESAFLDDDISLAWHNLEVLIATCKEVGYEIRPEQLIP
jgi:hypothetical protein